MAARRRMSNAELERRLEAAFGHEMVLCHRGARRQLLAALKLAESIDWPDEHRELLLDSTAQVRATLDRFEDELTDEVS